ncbi:globin CTT-VIIB-3 [Sitodiplosis mosellana]|uniref:globin CTT-VIIB-3 n=1 Tax=Sitodiplosis mosellana TaxID=263140 RepID=UPI002443BC67|nr:globin CTT-VIIB-3 [Sitodiplosis mosellana]XP_055303354.1 globin CTT-VIIB-3 [Sitodiplosis mosellana]
MMTSLTSEQIAIIQSTWAIPAQNAIDSGEVILLAYFEKYPKNQEKFNSFKNTPLLSLKGTPGFRTHAGRVMGVFQEAVSSLSNENYVDELERIWIKIGESHNRRKISRQSFEELRDVIVSVLMQVCSLDEAGKTAWSSLMDIIYHIVYSKIDEKIPY